MKGVGMRGLKIPEDGLRVRMYRMGLGDCFLISWKEVQQNRHMLIDFGLYHNDSKYDQKLANVRKSLLETCKGQLDYLVVTHEHWDHISGFEDEGFIRQLSVKQIWMAWTEEPQDSQSEGLQKGRDLLRRVLDRALKRIKETEAERETRANSESPPNTQSGKGSNLDSMVREILGFEQGAAAAELGPNNQRRSSEIMQRLKKLPTEFLRPGHQCLISANPEIRVTVLGPPLDEAYIKNTESKRQGVLYPKATVLNHGFIAALGPGGIEDPQSLSKPFDSSHECSGWKERKFFRRLYFEKGKEWRQIENDWLNQAHNLALVLDSLTNNTSLVLVIELGQGGPVLLFAGDAQVGNWRSWSKVNVDGKPLDLHDLLKRTVLYKVSHHGSHNGTLKDEGLERMIHPDLVALLPTDRKFALNKRWHMPVASLEQALKQKAKNRILSADQEIPDAIWPSTPEMDTTGLFVDYIVRGNANR